MTPNKLALDILNQELKQAQTVFDSIHISRLTDLNNGMSTADFVESCARTLLERETAMEFWKIAIEEVKHYMEQEGKTVVQALDESYGDRMEDCMSRTRGVNNCTCALTNASKGIKAAKVSYLVDDYRSIIRYIKREIKAE